jgi:phosphoserine aminotransferase
MRVFNFSPGPATLPEEVLKIAQRDLLDYNGCGFSVMEMSHRSKPYEEINQKAQDLLRELMNIPSNYEIIFVQGGATTQFEAVPLNISVNKKADYVVTGNFAQKAYKEARKYGDMAVAASSEDKNFTYIPKTFNFRDNIDYVHITTNNTIFGTRFTQIPKTDAPIVADMSSNILSEKIDVNAFGVIYAGAQKNLGPAGVTVVIVRNDLLDKTHELCPTMLKWFTQVKDKSLYNTPACWSVYIMMLVLEWLKNLGGLDYIQKVNEEKAKILYDFIDNSDFYVNKVNKEDRSIMNVPFTTPSPELDEKFIAEASKNGFKQLKGHRLVGGMRASIYNAMPAEGVQKLVEFMKKFELENK